MGKIRWVTEEESHGAPGLPETFHGNGGVRRGAFPAGARGQPAARGRDPHCDCTRATHQAIFETALERPFKVEVLESVRRGKKTCHFLVHVQE